MKILDILLLSKELFRKLSDRKRTFYVGIIIVGFIDVFLLNVLFNFSELFKGKAQGEIFYNLAMAIVLAFVMGFIDVIFFSLPLYDLFRHFKGERASTDRDTLVKIAKIYVLAHFPVVPINLVFNFILNKIGIGNGSITALSLALCTELILRIWFAAIISRGINIVYTFQPFFRRLVFAAVFFWSFLLDNGLQYIMLNWFQKLFR